MNVVDLLASLAKLDIRLWLEGENLRFNAPEGVFTGAVREQVVSRKADIIAFLKQARKLNEQPIPVVERGPQMPVSFSQQRLWVLDRLNPNDVTYNMSSALRIKGALNFSVLEKVFAALVQRHESLRTRFIEVDGEPFQVIDPFESWQLALVDCSGIVASAHEQCVLDAVNESALTPYNLASGPLFRAQVLKLSPQHHVLIAGMHHIISDAWSMEVMVKEIGMLYFAFSAGMSSPLSPLSIQYADFAAWQRNQVTATEMDKHQQYWVKTLTGAPPVLDIPTDRPRQDMPSNHGTLFKMDVPHELAQRINQACSQHDLTPFMFFLGAWQTLLGRIANSKDVVIGAPVAGRSRAEVQEIIGFFVNLLLMRLDLSGNPSVKMVLQRVKEMVLSGFTHQDMPIDRLMEVMAFERQPGYPPLAQSMFQLLNMNEQQNAALGSDNMSLEPIAQPHVTSRMDLVLGVAKLDDEYQLSMEYNTDLFNASSIVDMLNAYLKVLAVFAAQPEHNIDAIRLHDDAALLEALGFDSTTNQLLPLSALQRGLVQGSRFSTYVPIPADVSAASLTSVLQMVSDQVFWLRAEWAPCQVRGADSAYWIIPQSKTVELEVLVHDASDLDALEQAILNLPAKGGEGVLFYRAALKSGQSFLVLSVLQGLLDALSVQQLMVSIQNGIATGVVPSLAVAQSGRIVVENSEANLAHWRDALQNIEALHFSKPVSTSPTTEKGVKPMQESVRLDFRQRDAIVEYCAAHGLSLAQYCKVLFALVVQHYCRPEAGFALREIVSASGNQGIGFAEQHRPVVVPVELLARDATLLNWFAVFSAKVDAGAVSSGLLKDVLPVAGTQYSFQYLHDVPGTLSGSVEAGTVHLQVNNTADGLAFKLNFDADRFVSLQFLQRMLHISEQIVFGEVQRVRQLTFLSSGELHQLHDLANGDAQTTAATVVQQIIDQAAKTPDSIALRSAQDALTYRELDERSNQLAHLLTQKGVTANVRIGVCLNRSIDLIVSILAVLKAGGAYVPMDPAYPRERLAFMAADSAAPLIISRSDCSESLGSCQAELLLLDQLAAALAQLPVSVPVTLPVPEQQIYVIYTSGSTGQPKGAMVVHRGESNLQQWYLSALKLGPQDRTLLISAVGFDLTQKNIFAPLLVGGTLVLPDMELFDETELLELIERHHITWVNCAPSALYPLVESAADNHYQALQSLRYVVLGGEPIRMNALYPWLSHGSCQARVVNSYGPTECTDVVAWYCADHIESAQQVLPIGKPVNSTQVYVLNDYLNPVVPGLVGEICVAGTGVGLGYIDRPDITAASFVENPFSDGKLYRTGDLGRYLPDGNIDYLGRKDFQVKLRGLRIELGEIEFALRQLSGVQDALVMVRDETLLGYVVAAETFANLDWRPRLRDYLPEYMIPAAIVAVPAWPLTPNGKIDRKALLAFHDLPNTTDRVLVEPVSDTEREILKIWQDVLGIEEISVEDDFFAIGGHSLQATRVVSRLHKSFKVKVPLRDLFQSSTIRNGAALIDRLLAETGRNQLPEIVPIDRKGPLPLSFVQQQLWLLDQLDPGTPAYNMPMGLRIRGVLDVAAFETAFRQVIQRHETMRSNFVTLNGAPSVIIHGEPSWQFEVVDLSNQDSAQQEARVKSLAAAHAGYGFDLAKDRLIRGSLLVLGTGSDGKMEHVFVGAIHHMIADGWSSNVIVSDLIQFYYHLTRGAAINLPELPVQYVDIAAWQRNWLQGDVLASHIAYWRDRLDNEDQVLELPTDFPRPAVMTSHGATVRRSFDLALVDKARHIAAEEGATLFMVLLASFQLLMARYSGQKRINVGTPIAGRESIETENLVGFFINTVVLSAEIDEARTFRELLRQVREATLSAYEHQALPFEKIIEELKPRRDTSRTPFFQVFMNLLNLPPQSEAEADLVVEPLPIDDGTTHAKYDLHLYLRESTTGLDLLMVYNTDLFRESTVEYMMEDFTRLVKGVLNAAETALWKIGAGKHESISVLPDIKAPLPVKDCVSPIAAFLQQAQSQPSATAIRWQGNNVSYTDLERASARIRNWLASKNLGENSSIAIIANRTPHLVTSLLGVLRAGAVFTVIDASYPAERLASVVRELNPVAALSLCPLDAPLLEFIAPVLTETGCQHLALVEDALAAELPDSPDRFDNHRRAYIAFTSGTTGIPKGILGAFGPVAHFVEWYCQAHPFSANDTFSLLSGLSHDPLLRDIFVPLSVGASIAIPDEDILLQPARLVDWFRQEGISISHLTPAMARLLMTAAASLPLDKVRLMGLGGDRLTPDVVQGLRNVAPGAQLLNFYGATETPQVMAVYEVPLQGALPATLPLGRGIEGVQLLVLDEHLQVCAPLQCGQVAIRTPYLTLGYTQPDQQHMFRVNPHTHDPRDRIYLTGDKGRFQADGTVEYLGRLDQQIKIRGFRIEPAEIRTKMLAMSFVADAVVVPALDPQGEVCMASYVVLNNVEQGWQDLLRGHLRAALPDYMVPALVIEIDAVPLTPNGKLNKSALPDPAAFWVSKEYIAPRNEYEQEIARIWQEVMKRDQIGVEDHFFDIGGHSLLAVQIVARVKEKYSVEFSMRRLFEVATIAGMASYVENAAWLKQGESAVDGQASDDYEEIEI